ncbi:DUF2239 family protein [Prosthecomicrobium pneumaticum]|uniref:DUF2239 domain-containing protein n=1 Tax=Prosthecomicrobium pneumaticum TaxID=81895 RepID=A0A7W9CTZ3_9HYPH|nr:DUF2239 family protein [Prosthecomicrobium pneumaticum]MBB5751599.1 hypothetical protein [Prosthecomicrobium pneumaticum]
MSDRLSKPSTAFEGARLLLSGPLVDVALAVKAAAARAPAEPLLVFDDATGRVVDLDLRGGTAELIGRLTQPAAAPAGRYRPRAAAQPEEAAHETAEPRGRGRPRLGVVAREVTLLPRQWDWLGAQPGGASAALRRLVDEARRNGGARQERRTAQEAAYRFMLAIAGDRPGYEEATRALFADDRTGMEARMADWPEDIRAYALRLAFGAEAAAAATAEAAP